MGSIVSAIYDEIKLHGSWENYCTWRDREKEVEYFPDPEEIPAKELELGLPIGIMEARLLSLEVDGSEDAAGE